MEMAGGTWTNGIDKLHRAVRHRHVPVLWHRFGMGQHDWVASDGGNRTGGLFVSDAVQSVVAFRVQIWSVGVDMADADLWEMAGHKMKLSTCETQVRSLLASHIPVFRGGNTAMFLEITSKNRLVREM